MFVVGEIGNFRSPPALLIESTDGATNVPSSRSMSATPRPLDTAKSYDRYPTEPSVCEIAAATPSFPSRPVPVGHSTALSAPTSFDHAELSAESHEVNTNVVPDSSDRCTTEIGVFGSCVPWFNAWIAGSFHDVMSPMKIFAAVSPSSLSPLWRPETLYAITTPPSTVGTSM